MNSTDPAEQARDTEPTEVPEGWRRPRPPPALRGRVPGQIVASEYRLSEVIGSGGMGTVWRARHLTLDIDIALKLIHPEASPVEGAKRMLREARAAARLAHPSICRIFEFSVTDRNEPFIAMELLEGESLADRLRREAKIPPEDAVRLLLPVASALVFAHEHGIVHRDVKPENIFLSEAQGGLLPKLVDFGVAKLTQASHKPYESVRGFAVGSPEYMAPEQARGASDVDQRADIWALCVVLYETVAGRRPFDGGDRVALTRAILHSPPATLADCGVDEGALWGIVQRGLCKARAERWRTMRTLGVSLAEWAVARGVHADVSGGSVIQHWLGDQDLRDSRAPLSSGDWSSTPAASEVRQADEADDEAAPSQAVAAPPAEPIRDEVTSSVFTGSPPPTAPSAMRRALGAGAVALAAVAGTWFLLQRAPTPAADHTTTAAATTPARSGSTAAKSAAQAVPPAARGDTTADGGVSPSRSRAARNSRPASSIHAPTSATHGPQPGGGAARTGRGMPLPTEPDY